MNKPVSIEKRAAIKSDLVDAIRKTGHVAEGALEAVAEVAVTVVLSGAVGVTVQV